ncbi:MAG: phosphate/phosphite/phosphonate ABC transporter substrate-binding protein [Acidobacteria bacterium]|nr:phosphate/phosphite/phosphonate ABC transporter substrate-binding protein [Acidobacteriota bacterium]
MPKSDKKSSDRPLRIGAVAYDPKVVTIWEGFKDYFHKRGVEIDYVLYSHYDAQVDAMLSGEIDIAWNSPLAWVRTDLATKGKCQALAMRDSDRDLTTHILVRQNSNIASVLDLKGKTIAVGASDSPQATLIPLAMLTDAGLVSGKDFEVLYHEVMFGKHGDHVGGERDAARALASGQADAACVLDSNFTVFVNEGTLDPGTTKILATTPPYDHCNFTALTGVSEKRSRPFVEVLLAMSFEDPSVRTFMELEGLNRWLPARTSGYQQLQNAVSRFKFYA